jgi:energy-coupling factor transporter ATP-binding protein EcfA2
MEVVRNIELENFKGYRCFSNGNPHKFDLDADLVLITGKNGVGKTSLLEAMDWVLNHPKESSGDLLTNGEKSGSVCVNGNEFQVTGKGKVDRRHLSTVSSFFYQENIGALACNDIIQLLEPDNKPAAEIKQDLKKLQVELDAWQRKLNALKYRKNYEEERRVLADKINTLVVLLPEQSPLRNLLEARSLTINSGNLSSKWDSQVKNLSRAIGDISNRAEAVGARLPQQLGHIGRSLIELNAPQTIPPQYDALPIPLGKGFISTLQNLPRDLEIKKWSASDNPFPGELESTLYISTELNVYAETIKGLEGKQDELRKKYKVLADLKAGFSGDGTSLLHWVETFKANVDGWLRAWSDHTEEHHIGTLKDQLLSNITELKSHSIERNNELQFEISKVEEQGKELANQLNQARRLQAVAKEIELHSSQLIPLLSEPSFSIKELEDFVSVSAVEEKVQTPSKIQQHNELDIAHQLGAVFKRWEQLEIDKEQDENNVADIERIELAEALISSASVICKHESSAKSQLLSLVGAIPKAELEQLVQNMNDLLSSFHFSEDFLPISLENGGTEKNPNWGFNTRSGVKFEDLSTGQKSQLAICWTINLNLALADKLGHRVIGFDDFTTSLDMNQMIPAAVLLRKLAYANDDDSWKRQVIVTSHHEDLTNRLLDFLLPPEGGTMKVIQFEDWSVEKGPNYKCYNVDMGNVDPEGLEGAIKIVVDNL